MEEGIYIVTKTSGEVYVGQSGNITSRLARHVADQKFTEAEVQAAQRIDVPGGKTAREVAEQLIDSFGGRDAPGVPNKVNPVGPARIKLMGPGYTRP